MCLEFLCSWSHKEEDGPEHHGQSHRTSLPPAGTEYPARGESPSKPRYERTSNGTDTWNSDTNLARQDPPLKPRPEPYSGNKNPVVSGVAVNNGDTKRKDENPKTSSMVFNGDKDLKAVHPRPSALVRSQVANNTVLAAPVQQPNLRRGADDEEEEEEVSKAAQTRNRRY